MHGEASDINKAVLCELDQEIDMLAPDEHHPASSLPANELDNRLSEKRRSLATADLAGAQVSHPGLANLHCCRRERDARSPIRIRE
jgi:hypothetical protein